MERGQEAIAAHQERSALLETAKVQLETDTTQAQAESSKARGELEAMQVGRLAPLQSAASDHAFVRFSSMFVYVSLV